MIMETFVTGLQWYVVFLFSTTLHEASHALAAWKLGDTTAYEGGQVTLDPLPHIRREPIGLVAVPIISFLLGGWMMGWASVPYNKEWALSYPKRSAMMSLAGPMANFLLVLLAVLLIRVGVASDMFYPPDSLTFSHIVEATEPGNIQFVASFLSLFFSLNLLLFLFNLLPVPPLDGSGIIPFFMSHETAQKYLTFLHNSPAGFFGLFIAWKVFGYIYSPMHLIAVNLLYPGYNYH
jgi:Zn-dependent protease